MVVINLHPTQLALILGLLACITILCLACQRWWHWKREAYRTRDIAIAEIDSLGQFSVQKIRELGAAAGVASLWTCWAREPGELRGCGWTNTSEDSACRRCGSKAVDGYGFRI